MKIPITTKIISYLVTTSHQLTEDHSLTRTTENPLIHQEPTTQRIKTKMIVLTIVKPVMLRKISLEMILKQRIVLLAINRKKTTMAIALLAHRRIHLLINSRSLIILISTTSMQISIRLSIMQ